MDATSMRQIKTKVLQKRTDKAKAQQPNTLNDFTFQA